MSHSAEEQTPSVPLEEEWAPPPYESLDPPLNFHNPRFEPREGEEEDEPPPPYSPGAGNSLDAPPDYYSLFGQIRNAQLESDNNFTFLKKVGLILLNTVGCTVLLVVFMSVPITVLVLGAIFVGECSLEPNIPIFLIVGGISGVLKNLFLILESMSKRCPHRFHPCSPKKRKYLKYAWKIFNIIFTLFMLAWIIAGSYWIYHIYSEVMRIDFGKSSSDGRSCNELLYKFSFGILTSSYILLVLMLCCTCCCSCCLNTNPAEEEGEEEEEDPGSRSRESGQESREGYEGDESLGGSLHSDREETGVVDQDLYVPPSEDHYWTHNGDGESSPNHTLNDNSVVQPDSTIRGQDDRSREGARQNTCDNFNLQMNLTEYTNSPILSPPHRPDTIPFLSQSETSSNLYTTENEYGYSCTAV